MDHQVCLSIPDQATTGRINHVSVLFIMFLKGGTQIVRYIHLKYKANCVCVCM